MKRILIGFLLCGAAFAQSIALSVSPASVPAGGTATLTLTYTDASPSANLAGLEWTFAPPTGATQGTLAPGAATTAAAKVISCGTAACIDAGTGPTLNANVIASGVLATIPITVTAGTGAGPLSLALTGVQGATSAGLVAAVTTTAATLTVLSKYDLNGDGVVNSADVQIMLGEAETGTCTAPSTGVGDGKCDVSDVVLEILASLGVIH